MDLERLYAGSFVDWEGVAASWAKRTVSSRLMLFAARRYLQEIPDPQTGPTAMTAPDELPEEIKTAFASPPDPEGAGGAVSRRWGEFVDAAVAAELEMVTYGERPPLLHELRAGLEQAASEAGDARDLRRWFLDRRDALPGTDLPDDPGFLPL